MNHEWITLPDPEHWTLNWTLHVCRLMGVASVAAALSLLAIFFVSLFLDMANLGYDASNAAVPHGVGNDGSSVTRSPSSEVTLFAESFPVTHLPSVRFAPSFPPHIPPAIHMIRPAPCIALDKP